MGSQGLIVTNTASEELPKVALWRGSVRSWTALETLWSLIVLALLLLPRGANAASSVRRRTD